MNIKSSKGFSLIELVIVIGILFILGEITMLEFIKYKGNYNLKEVARNISGDIQFCKVRAVTENTRYQMLFDVDNNQYTIQKETAPSTWEDVVPAKSICLGYGDIKIVESPTFAGDKIVFQRRGTTNNGTLEIQHRKLFSRARIIVTLMGRVRVAYELK